MPKCDFNKVDLLKLYFGMGALPWICCIFSKHLFIRTPTEGRFYCQKNCVINSCGTKALLNDILRTSEYVFTYNGQLYIVLDNSIFFTISNLFTNDKQPVYKWLHSNWPIWQAALYNCRSHDFFTIRSLFMIVNCTSFFCKWLHLNWLVWQADLYD